MLDRRKPGGTAASTTRREPDQARILSGVFEGKTTGTPVSILVENKDPKSRSYEPFARLYRPGHGDYTYQKKYGIRDWRGGGRASARETVARVAAGAVASVVLGACGIHVRSCALELGGVRAERMDWAEAEKNPYRCPDAEAAARMEQRAAEARAEGDSVGGIVLVEALGVPPGLGEPVFGKLDALLACAMMGVGAVKGVEIGSGFAAARMTGSRNNDPITPGGFLSNNAGGILAGISNGAPVVIRVAVKPIPSIGREQQTVDEEGRPAVLRVTGRHDVCAIPRICVVLEAMAALVLADCLLMGRALWG
jgi:chorismate synthase